MMISLTIYGKAQNGGKKSMVPLEVALKQKVNIKGTSVTLLYFYDR